MDTKTLNLDFGQEDSEKLKELLRRMGEFIAYFEVAESKMIEWKREVELAVIQHQQDVNAQLSEIKETTSELKEVMTEAGAARWRISAEQALSQGKQTLVTLEKMGTEQLKQQEDRNETLFRIVKKSFERLDRASTHTIKHVNDAVNSVNVTELRQLSDNTRAVIEETSHNAIKAMTKMCNWFHWKNLTLVALVTLVVSITMGLYLNGEMPWEIHNRVVLQRNAGKALIDAWPTLSQSEKERILRHANSTFT